MNDPDDKLVNDLRSISYWGEPATLPPIDTLQDGSLVAAATAQREPSRTGLRKFVLLVAALVLMPLVSVVLLTATWGTSTDETIAAGGGSTLCPVTVPPVPGFLPDDPWPSMPNEPGMVWYGSAELWVPLAATGYIPRKSVWWSANFTDAVAEPMPEISVRYERLDVEVPDLVFDAPGTNAHTSADGLFMINGAEPNDPGCWRATGTYKGATLSYVYEVPEARGSEEG